MRQNIIGVVVFSMLLLAPGCESLVERGCTVARDIAARCDVPVSPPKE